MPRSHLVHACLLLLPATAACFNPRTPIVVSESDGEEGESSADTTMGSGDPTTASTVGTTEPTTSASTSASTTAETADTTASTSDTDPTDTDAGSTDEGGPLCGNAMVDDGEACDDGNEVNGDGCNVDCIESGTVLWTVDFAEDYELPEGLHQGNEYARVALAPDGTIYAAARLLTYGRTSSLITALEPDGDTIWQDTLDAFSDDYLTFGLSASASGVVSCGFVGGGVLGHGVIQTHDAEGARRWSATWSTASAAAARGCLFLDDGDVVVVGNDDIAARLRRYSAADGTEVWSDGTDTGLGYSVALRSDGLLTMLADTIGRYTDNGVFASAVDLGGLDARAVVAGPGGSEFVAGLGNGSVHRRYDDGVLTWSHVTTASAHEAIAVDAEGNAIVVGRDADDIWVRKLSTAGDELWTATHAGDGGGVDIASGVAVDTDDNIYVVGTAVTADGGRRAWLRKYAP